MKNNTQRGWTKYLPKNLNTPHMDPGMFGTMQGWQGLINFIKKVINTAMEVNSKAVAQFTNVFSIYQGDVLSPLLFYIGLNLYIIIKSRYGYWNGLTIGRLLYIYENDSLIHLSTSTATTVRRHVDWITVASWWQKDEDDQDCGSEVTRKQDSRQRTAISAVIIKMKVHPLSVMRF